MAIDVVTLALAKKYAKSQVNNVTALSPFSYKGAVANYAELPTTATMGDVYTDSETTDEYLWTGEEWIKLGKDYPYTVTIDI